MSSAILSAHEAASSQPTVRDLTISLARSREDLRQAFRLVYQSYYDAGLAVDTPSGMRLTPFHLVPTTEVLVAKLDDTVTSTLSMIGDGYLGLPMQSMYPREIKELRDQGLRLAEIGSLADRRDSPVRFIETFAELGRLLVQVAHSRGIDGFVVATHPKHARLYKRVMGFRQIGELSDCPYANGNPAVALVLKFDEHAGTSLHERYFGNPCPPSDLVQYRWDRDTRSYFRRALQRDKTIATLAGIQGYYNWAAITGNLTV
ncbi:N-acyl amino acid synthase FeeM domain-containing protein [Novipirellula maiorica]|uniref:N-acyl amino acid synthase FeeM domain-containing protein n=1 Tax=Novipirellula maiorica TaxID=1265734 RepID=UPI0007C6B053|nr:hypothetical protein [Rhodopirellula maiorica]